MFCTLFSTTNFIRLSLLWIQTLPYLSRESLFTVSIPSFILLPYLIDDGMDEITSKPWRQVWRPCCAHTKPSRIAAHIYPVILKKNECLCCCFALRNTCVHFVYVQHTLPTILDLNRHTGCKYKTPRVCCLFVVMINYCRFWTPVDQRFIRRMCLVSTDPGVNSHYSSQIVPQPRKHSAVNFSLIALYSS